MTALLSRPCRQPNAAWHHAVKRQRAVRRKETKHEKQQSSAFNSHRAGTAMAASLIAAPTMAELNQECLFTGEIVQKQADTPFRSDSPASMTRKCSLPCSVVARDRRCNSKPLMIFRRCQRVQKSCIGIRNSKMATPHGSCCQRRPPSNHVVPIKKKPAICGLFYLPTPEEND